MRSGLRGSLYLLLVGGLQHHRVVLWAVSTLITKAFIEASCHGVVLWFVQDRRVVIDPRVSLAKNLCFSCHCHTLLSFTCSDDFLSLSLACMRAAVPSFLNFAVRSSFCWMRPQENADPFFLTWLCTSLSAGVPRLRHVWWSFLALFQFLFHLKLVCSRSATSYLATAVLSARGRASTCSGPCCESSSGSSVSIFALVESRQFSAQP